jgi:hypothetical protein
MAPALAQAEGGDERPHGDDRVRPGGDDVKG